MTVLPIVERELRVASRKRGTYWNRLITASVGVVVLVWILLATRYISQAQGGQILFWALSFCFFWVAMLAGLLHTSDCLSSEKREGTLGLLFLTRLTGWDVIGGKLTATSLNACYGLLSVIPILAIPLLMGGVTLPEFGRVVLVVSNILFFSLSAGMAASALVRRTQAATALTFLVLLLGHALGPMLGLIVGARTDEKPSELFFVFSGGFAGVMTPTMSYRMMPWAFWLSVLLTHAEAWLLLVVASLTARWSWQERPSKKLGLGWRGAWRRLLYGDKLVQARLRRLLLDRNPGLWLSARHRYRRWLVWGALLALGLAWVYGYKEMPEVWISPPIFILTALVLHLVILTWVTSEAVALLGPDLRSGALELVLATSISVRDLLWGHWLGLRRQFLGPTVVVITAELAMMAAGLSKAGSSGIHGSEEVVAWSVVWLVAMGLQVFSWYTVAWLGMWQGVKQKQANRASGNCVTIVVILPWVLLGLGSTLLGLAGWRWMPHPGVFLACYAVIQVLVNTLAVLWARDRLLRGLRGQVARRFGEQRASARARITPKLRA